MSKRYPCEGCGKFMCQCHKLVAESVPEGDNTSIEVGGTEYENLRAEIAQLVQSCASTQRHADTLLEKLHAAEREASTAYARGMARAAEIAEDYPTSASVYAKVEDAKTATATKQAIVDAIRDGAKGGGSGTKWTSRVDELAAEAYNAHILWRTNTAEVVGGDPTIENPYFRMDGARKVAPKITVEPIRAEAAKGGEKGEACEWTRPRDWNGMHDTGCGHLLDYEESFKFCPYCGKTILVKEG